MFLPFEKWHGCLNDFIVIWLSQHEAQYGIDSLKRQAGRLCSKKGDGIGADGILVIHTATKRDFHPEKLTIINHDGSFALNCGNGLRCAALSVYRKFRQEGPKGELPEEVTFVVEGREMICQFLPSPNKSSHLPFVAIDMGLARLNNENSWHDSACKAIRQFASASKLTSLTQDFYSCEIGNPHLVFFVDELSPSLLQQIGPALQKQEELDGVNVHLVCSEEASAEDAQQARRELGQSISEIHRALVWERGVGMTPACGSGACAIVAAALSSGFAAREEWMGVEMPGGRLYVKQSAADMPLVLAGPAQFVFSGEVEV